MEVFDVIINVIGELPENIFQNNKELEIIILNNNIATKSKLKERIVKSKSKCINFYVLDKEYFLDYPYLTKIIQNCFLKGDKILIHCEYGLIRSAGLLLFYLRRYFFNTIEDANNFISLKRETAEASKLIFSIIEKLIKKVD